MSKPCGANPTKTCDCGNNGIAQRYTCPDMPDAPPPDSNVSPEVKKTGLTVEEGRVMLAKANEYRFRLSPRLEEE